MKGLKICWLILIGFCLTHCSKSPEVKFYVLNPIATPKHYLKNSPIVRIGLEDVSIPPYMAKSQFIVHYTPNRVRLNEFDQWAGLLDKNIQRVVKTNLLSLLPNTIIMSFPWDSQFKPDYQLYVDISQFEVDIQGNSLLRANYVIYSGNVVKKKESVCFRQQVPVISVDTLVSSMNHNLNLLSEAIAKSFVSVVRTADTKKTEPRPLGSGK